MKYKHFIPIILFFLVITSFLISGCSSKLSRSEAKDMIMKNYRYPKSFDYTLLTGVTRSNIFSDMEYLEEQGFITIKRSSSLKIQLTEVGKEQFERGSGNSSNLRAVNNKQAVIDERDGKIEIWHIHLCDIEFVEITGITQNEQTAKIEYSLQLANPNLSVEKLISKDKYLGNKWYGAKNPIPYTLTINMSKYDDGWRIE